MKRAFLIVIAIGMATFLVDYVSVHFHIPQSRQVLDFVEILRYFGIRLQDTTIGYSGAMAVDEECVLSSSRISAIRRAGTCGATRGGTSS